jgi:hypothetical protein
MHSMTLAVVLLAMLAGGMFWYWQALPKQAPSKKSARAGQAKRVTPAKKSLPAQAPGSRIASDSADKYRAVSVQCRGNACAAAKALGKQRFLVAEAPALPLPKCDQTPCHCSYMHHADRRSGEDDRRSVHHSLQTELYTRTAGQERRGRRGRRKTDHI